jgi:hypothetical protein
VLEIVPSMQTQNFTARIFLLTAIAMLLAFASVPQKLCAQDQGELVDFKALTTEEVRGVLFGSDPDNGVEAAVELAKRTSVNGEEIFESGIWKAMMRSLTDRDSMHRLRAVQYFYLIFYQVEDPKIAVTIIHKLEAVLRRERDLVVSDALRNAIAEGKQNHDYDLNHVKHRVSWRTQLSACLKLFQGKGPTPQTGPQ